MAKITKDNDIYTVTTGSVTSKVTVEEAQKYNDNRETQISGVVIGLLGPLMMTGLFNGFSTTPNISDVISQKEARQICLQENFDKVSSSENETVNLSKPEIKACASKKIIESGNERVAAIKQSEENKTQMTMAFSGALAVGGLVVMGAGFVPNAYLRRKKPGIKQAAKFERRGF